MLTALRQEPETRRHSETHSGLKCFLPFASMTKGISHDFFAWTGGRGGGRTVAFVVVAGAVGRVGAAVVAVATALAGGSAALVADGVAAAPVGTGSGIVTAAGGFAAAPVSAGDFASMPRDSTSATPTASTNAEPPPMARAIAPRDICGVG